MQTAYFYQYDDGIEHVPDKNGAPLSESVNIKLFAESLLDEKAQWVAVTDKNGENGSPHNGGDRRQSTFITTETHSASGKETHHIYDGERVAIKELKKFKILTARTGLPAVKIANFIKKCGKDELIKVLNK